MTPEASARQTIDALLTAACWHVCDVSSANLRTATGVAIREFPLDAGHGFAGVSAGAAAAGEGAAGAGADQCVVVAGATRPGS